VLVELPPVDEDVEVNLVLGMGLDRVNCAFHVFEPLAKTALRKFARFASLAA
jgi:hypothetical protein